MIEVDSIIDALGNPQGFPSVLVSLQNLDLDALSANKRQQMISAICAAVSLRGGPLLMLSLPASVLAEIALFSTVKIPGVDRSAYKKATPWQIVRRLTTEGQDKCLHDFLIENCNFAAFRKEHWQEYFSRCTRPIAAARSFLLKGEDVGGFSDDEIARLALKVPSLVPCIPAERLMPKTAVALLISGRAETLWDSYDFSLLSKEHWQDLLSNTNPVKLPEACRPFVENKDGAGFTDGELLAMAQRCHALINLLDPDKVPFNIAYELYLTGKADLLWKNYPFAKLDKSEWRKIISNPDIRIPEVFLEVAQSGRFMVQELFELALRNERLHPIIVAINIPPRRIVDILLAVKAEYIWDNYQFCKFSVNDWERLILGIRGEVVRPRAMAALRCCKGITETFTTKILSWNTAYAPNLPISTITPDTAVDILLRENGYYLWSSYDFGRLNDGQWLRLLEGTSDPIPPAGEAFLRNRAGWVDNSRLNVVLARRNALIKFVDARYIAPDLAVSLLIGESDHELWLRYDFLRFNRAQLRGLMKVTKRSGLWPDSLKACFRKAGSPLDPEDLTEIACTRPEVVIDNISLEWTSSLDDALFETLMKVASRGRGGRDALRRRLPLSGADWNKLPIGKLKQLLIAAPELRPYVNWQKWAFRDIADLVKAASVFEEELHCSLQYFFWKHLKRLVVMASLTAVVCVAFLAQNSHCKKVESQRRHWNRIVARVQELNQQRAYQALKEYWHHVPPEDVSILGKDLFVRRALENLQIWEAESAKVDLGMTRLREMAKLGWETSSEDAVFSVIADLEQCHVNRFAVADEFAELKASHIVFRKAEADRLRLKGLRAKIEGVRRQISKCSDLAQLTEWQAMVWSFREETGLRDLVVDVIRELMERSDLVKEQESTRLARDFAAISNAVYSVFADLRRPSAITNYLDVANRTSCITQMRRFAEYSKQPCHAEYTRLTEDVALFGKLREAIDGKLSEAMRLDARFAKEFLTIEGGVACSNVVAYCDMSMQTAEERHWVAIKGEYARIKAVIDNIQARDLRCWALVDKLNVAKDYAGYLKARSDLVKEFGDYAQIRHLGRLEPIGQSDLNLSYCTTEGGGRLLNLTRFKYRYRYVGLIRLQPESPSNTTVDIMPGTTPYNADLYTLWKSTSGTVEAQKLITQQGAGQYYRISGVDYSSRQGTPLFVRNKVGWGE